MVIPTVSRARIAALILSCVGLVLAASSTQASSQAASSQLALGQRETPSAALARNLRILATAPKNFEALIGAGNAALELGDTQAAAGFFGRADEVHSASPLPQIGMGAAAVTDGDAQQALAYLVRAQQLGANGAMVGKDRGLAYDLLGRHAEAQADYRAAMMGADADEARRRLALSLAITGDKAGALALLGPLMARGDAAGARTRAFVLALSGDSDGARRSLEAAMPGSSASMAPFFARLPSLRSGERAAAVNLGLFPGAGQPSFALSTPQPGQRTPTYTTAPTVVAQPRPRPTPPPVSSATAAASAAAEADRLASIEQLLRSPTPNETPQPRASDFQIANVAATARPPAATSTTAAASTTATATASATASATGAAKQRYWVQLASGQDPSALPAQFQRMKRRYPDMLDGLIGYVAEAPDRARLLIGPFKSAREASDFAGDLESERVDAFSWTSPPGQTVRKISTE